jgi:MYXO-CTERM domain-containing protein
VFQYAPDPSAGAVEADLVDVDLTALRPAFVGDYLKGDYVETFNCCKEYVCLDGSAECELEGRRCARPTDNDAIPSELVLEIPTEQFNVPLLPPTLFARSVFCSELPRVRSTTDGWEETPVDVQREDNDLAGRASEEDAFAEVQAYYATMVFFEHMRDVMGDDTWCLGGNSMQCESDGSPTLGSDGEPVRAFHIAVNSLIPELDFEVLATQLLAGKGSVVTDPLLIEDYQRIDNAAFVPANSGAPIDVPPELNDLLDIFNRDYDSNLYFQGVADFAYDGDIVFHEFTHAIIYSFVPTLGSLWHDKWGAHAQPGALNEGWSDYFSMSFTGDPVTAEYGGQGIIEGELGLRNASAGKNCPDDITGEVHDDSIPWSSALWAIREAVVAAEGAGAVNDLDNALLLALAQAEDNESFEDAAARVLEEVETAFDASLRASAETALENAGVTGCERVHALSEVDADGELVVNPRAVMFMNGPDEIGTSNMAPSTMQYRVDVPANTTAIGLRWRQQNGGIGQFTQTGDAAAVPRLLLQEIAGPIEWRYEGAQGDTALPFDADGDPIDFDPLDPENNGIVSTPNNNGISVGNYDITLESDPCSDRTFWLQYVSVSESLRITDLEVQIETAEEECVSGEGEGEGEGEPEPCACTATDAGPAPFGMLALLGVIALLRRRRR